MKPGDKGRVRGEGQCALGLGGQREQRWAVSRGDGGQARTRSSRICTLVGERPASRDASGQPPSLSKSHLHGGCLPSCGASLACAGRCRRRERPAPEAGPHTGGRGPPPRPSPFTPFLPSPQGNNSWHCLTVRLHVKSNHEDFITQPFLTINLSVWKICGIVGL